jgi:hypothetical protein
LVVQKMTRTIPQLLLLLTGRPCQLLLLQVLLGAAATKYCSVQECRQGPCLTGCCYCQGLLLPAVAALGGVQQTSHCLQ